MTEPEFEYRYCYRRSADALRTVSRRLPLAACLDGLEIARKRRIEAWVERRQVVAWERVQEPEEATE